MTAATALPRVISVAVAPGEEQNGLLRDIPAIGEILFPDGHIEHWEFIVRPRGPIYEIKQESVA